MSTIPAQTMSTSTAGANARACDPIYELESNQVSVDTSTQQILITPDKTKYGPGETCRFVIPSGRANTMLLCSDSYITLKVTNKSGASIRPAQTIESIFSRLEVLHNESVETRTQTNVHAALRNDLQFTPNKLKLTQGLGANIANGGSATFCVPLRSSVCGVDCPKALPLFMMSGSDLVVQLTFASGSEAFTSANVVSYEVTNMYLGVSMVQLSSPAAHKIKSLYPNAVISTPFVGHSSSSVTAGGSYFQVPITARYARATKMEVVFRNNGVVNNNRDKVSVRDAPSSITSLQLDVGGVHLPTRAIDSIERCAYHSLMCERLHDDPTTTISFDNTAYRNSAAQATEVFDATNGKNPAAWFFCQNFDYIDKTFDTNSLVAGWDLKGVSTNLLLEGTLANNATMDVFTTNIATLAIRDSILRSWN